MHPPAPNTSALSCPAGGSAAERATLYGDLVSELQRCYAVGLLRRGAEELGARAPELVTLVESALGDASLWCEPLPHQAALVSAVDRREGDLACLLARVGLSLHAQGQHDSWSVRFNEPSLLRYRGQVLGPVSELAVSGAEIRSDGKPLPILADAEIRLADVRSLREVRVGGRGLHFVPAEVAALCPLPVTELADDAALAASLPVVEEALALMGEQSPGYVPWVLEALRTLVPVMRPEGAHRSTSFRNMPGCCVFGIPLDPVTLAELLVHEASHQYLESLRASRRLANGCDGSRYYSPFPKALRDVEGILVGYHAFANIACLMYDLRRSERCAEPAHSWLRAWEPHLRVCEEILGLSPGLTKVGESLWRPVQRELTRLRSKNSTAFPLQREPRAQEASDTGGKGVVSVSVNSAR